ncbi:MAG: hypothetical protein Q4Q58_02675 [Thermoplasmata archaeon]|nr:hypothetical protein [Thermoplasmata archaeon]
MSDVPNKMRIGFGLGLLGGVISIVAMSYAWTGVLDDMYTVGLLMLVAVMFFGTAGTFTQYSPVSGNTSLVISAMTLAVVVIAALYDATFIWVSVILAVVALCCILVAACPGTTKWIDGNRIV